MVGAWESRRFSSGSRIRASYESIEKAFERKLDGERRVRDRRETLVLFESPRRVGTTLARLAEVLGPRPACVARELTKLHEQVVRESLAELARRFESGARGEVTIVIGGAAPIRVAAADLDEEIRLRVGAGAGAREIAAALSRSTGVSRREVYNRVLALGRQRPRPGS